MAKVILIHYGEVGLKKRNRQDFEKQLAKNIARKLSFPFQKISLCHKSVILPLSGQRNEKKAAIKLEKVFGIAWFSFAWQVKSEPEIIKREIKRLTKYLNKQETFAVRVKRSNKKFPLSSIKLESFLGELIRKKSGAKVDLTHPEKTFFLEVRENKTYLFFIKHQGLGGLPAGSCGKVLDLLSGGIDSPVASWLVAKRGAWVDLLHFSSQDPKKTRGSKIEKIHQVLKNYLGPVKLFVLPYVHFQLAASRLPLEFRRYEVLLFRRFMLKAADKLTGIYGHKALVLGDNLSQVASQTLENLALTDKGLSLPVLRPLLGYDKEEIVSLAKKIGSFNLSTEPYKDCCSLLQKQPVTKGKWQIIEKAETQLDQERTIKETLKEIVIFE